MFAQHRTQSGEHHEQQVHLHVIHRAVAGDVGAQGIAEHPLLRPMPDGIAQCSINPQINVTFEETLRSMVRQDPDVLVLGERLSSLKINARLKPVGRKHRREIHATVASRREFEQKLADGEGFARNVVTHPVIPIKGVFDYVA